MEKSDLILVTGSAGFIGYSFSKKLLDLGYNVLGIDSLNSYYDVNLKYARNEILKKYPNYTFCHIDLCDVNKVKSVFEEYPIIYVCHLAAQAGVRYSLTHPLEYQKANIQAFIHLIEEASKSKQVKNFVYASSSSVYGDSKNIPFNEKDNASTPISLYGATKRANELMAYTYSHLYNLNCTGLRFFTVYGPWGRPDMALFLFTRAILEGKTIDVYNYGNMRRSFSYIDDITNGIFRCLENPFKYEIFNLGNDKSESLTAYIETIEDKLGIKANKNMLPIQPGDVPETQADITHAKNKLGYVPKTDIKVGISNFIDWFRDYYKM